MIDADRDLTKKKRMELDNEGFDICSWSMLGKEDTYHSTDLCEGCQNEFLHYWMFVDRTKRANL